MKNIAPDIIRQRLLIEGYYEIPVDETTIREYFRAITQALELRAYGAPTIFAPATGMGRAENMGYDAFVPLIDSGISLYVWTATQFFSTIIYTCKAFDEQQALATTRQFFHVTTEMAYASF
jgi:hypothetical protein